MRVFDWLARTAMLVLAALATLALIGSLASVSNSPVGDAFPGAPLPAEPAADALPQPTTEPRVVDLGNATVTVEAPVAAPALPPHDPEIARWLRALTYAVLALAAICAAGVVALARIGGRMPLR